MPGLPSLFLLLVNLVFFALYGAASSWAADTEKPYSVTAERLVNADAEPGNWLSHGRTYSEQRYSPLDQVDLSNVNKLGLDWYFDLNDHNVVEATPLVIDGIMYVTEAMGTVFALNAKDR